MRNYQDILEGAIQLLAKEEKLFCNEGDFVYSVGCKLGKPVRMEYPFRLDNSNRRVDMVIFDNGKKIPCECKYKTTQCSIPCEMEMLELHYNGGYNDNIEAFINDVVKLEKFIRAHDNCEVGYAIFLTNDKGYFHDLFTTKYKHNAEKPQGQYTTVWKPYGVINGLDFWYTVVEVR